MSRFRVILSTMLSNFSPDLRVQDAAMTKSERKTIPSGALP
jgi:hypothetical protein